MVPAPSKYEHLPKEELQRMASQLPWVHSIDLGGGLVTPGLWGTGNPSILQAMDRIDFRGAKVLDIGCWDGGYSFLAERRGASVVYSTDLVSQRDFAESPSYQIAHSLLGSKALYYPNVSVYEVEHLGPRDFDIVFFTGVYYHLKDPLRALAGLRRVMKDGAHMIVEGAILNEPGCFAQFLYRDVFREDPSNWWLPTPECARQWVECSYLEIVNDWGIWGLHPGGCPRLTLLAKAVRRADSLYSRVPEGLEEYDLGAS